MTDYRHYRLRDLTRLAIGPVEVDPGCGGPLLPISEDDFLRARATPGQLSLDGVA